MRTTRPVLPVVGWISSAVRSMFCQVRRARSPKALSGVVAKENERAPFLASGFQDSAEFVQGEGAAAGASHLFQQPAIFRGILGGVAIAAGIFKDTAQDFDSVVRCAGCSRGRYGVPIGGKVFRFEVSNRGVCAFAKPSEEVKGAAIVGGVTGGSEFTLATGKPSRDEGAGGCVG